MRRSVRHVPVRWRDPEESHRRLAQRSNQHSGLLQLLKLILDEYGALIGNTGIYTNGQTLTAWVQRAKGDLEETQLDPDITTGLITIAIDGLYTIQAYGLYTGNANNNYYGLTANIGGTLLPFGVQQYRAGSPGSSGSLSVDVALTAGDTVSLEAYVEAGGADTLTMVEAYLKVGMSQDT